MVAFLHHIVLRHNGLYCWLGPFSAGELGYDICVLNLADAGLTDDRLSHALSTTPPMSIVLLEDIDAAFVERHAA